MDVTDQVRALMKLPTSEIRSLAKGTSTQIVDRSGQTFQCTTWCEEVAPGKHRIVVSRHRIHGLGVSTLDAIDGFTIDASGKIDCLDQLELHDLFL